MCNSFARHGLAVDGRQIELVRGLFEDTLPAMPDAPVALAHIDCDWYEPVRLCLGKVLRNLSPGGFVIVDDYHDWEGARRATDEVVAGNPGIAVRRRAPHAVLQRIAPIAP